MSFQQTYKNPAQAFRLFIAAQNLPVKQAKFYQDCDRLRMKKQDKSVDLATLLAYVKDELKIDLATGQSVVEKSRDAELAELDYREKKLKVEKLEKEGRKDDRNWLQRETVEEREGALVGAIFGELLYRLNKEADAVIAICGGNPEKTAAVKKLQENSVFAAFRALYDSGEIDITFEEEEEP